MPPESKRDLQGSAKRLIVINYQHLHRHHPPENNKKIMANERLLTKIYPNFPNWST
jgi:hypothetical protein